MSVPITERAAVVAAVTAAAGRTSATIALETYEQLPTDELVDLVRRVASPALGVCLDPANVVMSSRVSSCSCASDQPT